MNKYYKYAVIIPSVLVIGFTFLITIGRIVSGADKYYKSEWLTADSMNSLTILIVVLNAVLIALLSLPIYLNNYIRIRDNFVWSFLSWFLLPCIWIGSILIKHFHYLIKYSDGLDSESAFVFTNTLPYLIGLCVAFAMFKRALKISST